MRDQSRVANIKHNLGILHSLASTRTVFRPFCLESTTEGRFKPHTLDGTVQSLVHVHTWAASRMLHVKSRIGMETRAYVSASYKNRNSCIKEAET